MAPRSMTPLAEKRRGGSSSESAKKPNLVVGACALLAFVTSKALVTILLDQCLASSGGAKYEFVFQTVLLFPFLMQVLFYTCEVCIRLGGFVQGLDAIWRARHDMAPAVFYSLVVASSMLLQTLSQSYLDASTFVVLMQLTLVFVALGERFILGKRSSSTIWSMVLLQAFFVSYYQLSAQHTKARPHLSNQTEALHGINRTRGNASLLQGATSSQIAESRAADDKHLLYWTGIGLCFWASVLSALGNILQQRFLQTVNVNLLTSIKLLYQHVIGLALMAFIAIAQPAARNGILHKGFFHGWNHLVALTSLCMWMSFLTASAVTAFISAMAGAMGSAVVVIVVGTYGAIALGHHQTLDQVISVFAIACTTTVYTYLKGAQRTKVESSNANGSGGQMLESRTKSDPSTAGGEKFTRYEV